MSVKTATNRFIDPPGNKSVELYQQLLNGLANYERLGSKLIFLSEQARSNRQFDALSKYAQILSAAPAKQYRIIGQYYLALVLCRSGAGELDKAQAVLENVASVAPLKYRAKALVTLSAIAWDKNRPGDTLKYCVEATRMGGFDLTTIQALKGIAVLKGREGFHRLALRDLEDLYPLVRYAPPQFYLDYLNSLAVELAECDRLDEAENISKIACSSPLVSVYPEWRETHDDIRLRGYKSRSPLTRKKAENVFQLPIRGAVPAEYRYQNLKPARVLNYLDWKKKMAKEANGEDEIDPRNMTDKEKLFKIIELSSSEGITQEQLDQILDAVLRITKRG